MNNVSLFVFISAECGVALIHGVYGCGHSLLINCYYSCYNLCMRCVGGEVIHLLLCEYPLHLYMHMYTPSLISLHAHMKRTLFLSLSLMQSRCVLLSRCWCRLTIRPQSRVLPTFFATSFASIALVSTKVKVQRERLR